MNIQCMEVPHMNLSTVNNQSHNSQIDLKVTMHVSLHLKQSKRLVTTPKQVYLFIDFAI